jgi:hypothetical protein
LVGWFCFVFVWGGLVLSIPLCPAAGQQTCRCPTDSPSLPPDDRRAAADRLPLPPPNRRAAGRQTLPLCRRTTDGPPPTDFLCRRPTDEPLADRLFLRRAPFRPAAPSRLFPVASGVSYSRVSRSLPPANRRAADQQTFPCGLRVSAFSVWCSIPPFPIPAWVSCSRAFCCRVPRPPSLQAGALLPPTFRSRRLGLLQPSLTGPFGGQAHRCPAEFPLPPPLPPVAS